ncbi:MAG: hypothetical protein MHM6MM_004326 [Cercozoa sp. M6MM]
MLCPVCPPPCQSAQSLCCVCVSVCMYTVLTQVMLPTTPPVAASAQTGNDVASLASSTKVSASSADSDGNSADDAASTTST